MRMERSILRPSIAPWSATLPPVPGVSASVARYAVPMSSTCTRVPFEPRSVVSGSARVRVCRAAKPARRQLNHGRPSCELPAQLPSACRARTVLRQGALSSFHTPMPIAILVISRVLRARNFFH
ncbi:hypothetical protein EVAR_95513_1 [Eumeta japonica]|uniref:Uncharacterized protein n=1 Tax=Eumeta variegata TaxID=151549 RepID=A0A4C1UK41_EUMVA|nr:hypothetical protein EVAR_95513_1 [Eumeta japonica]